MRNALVATMLAVAASAASADVQVVGGRVWVRAENAPLADVLDQMSDATDMNVVYDGAKPIQPLTVRIDDASPAAALQILLAERGVRFVITTDRSGERVRTLVVSTVAVEVKRAPLVAEARTDEDALAGVSEEIKTAWREGRPTDILPPWLPKRPEWWPAPGKAGAAATADDDAMAAIDPAALPAPATSHAPEPPAVSPFTPQGPGPIILPLPGAAEPASIKMPPQPRHGDPRQSMNASSLSS